VGEVEIVTRRRKWSPEDKAMLLAEVEAEGGQVKVVARRHGISESLLYNWRAAWKAATSMRQPEPLEFMPLGIVCSPPTTEVPIPAASGTMEIHLPSGARVHVDATVNEKALARVFRAMKGVL
jgi:transposase